MSWLGHGRAPVVRPGQMTKEVGELSMDVERAIAPALGLVPAPAHPGPSTVFRAKLRPAMNPGHDLPRPRLHDLLTESVQAPLTLVVAPAGSGKTSLVRSWAVDTELPLAWLTLDEDDGDPAQLWRSVLAALDSLAPGCADAGRLLRGPDGVARAVRALLDDLEAREPAPRVIVLDDVHVVAEDAAAKSLAVFLQHLPAWLHVVMVGRRAPRLPVHRMRARGLLGEVHFQELRFTTEEATDLLALLAPDLAEDVAAEVVARADGWAASIRLAALAARSAVAQDRRYQPDQDDRDQLDDYVWNEVLADECDQLLEVLTATAVVERVDGDLAPVLTSREDANALLALAEERSLCVSRRESGFEVHPLVREVLARELARRAPHRMTQLHALAGGWYEAHGDTVAALDHWLRADRPRDALRLLAARVLGLHDDGHVGAIVRTLDALPESAVLGDLDAMIEYAWSHVLVDRHRFVDLVDRVARLTRDDLGVDPVRDARVQVLESMSATLRGHWANGGSLARSALEELGDAWWLDPIGQHAWNVVARDLALAEGWDDAGRAAGEVLRALGAAPERRVSLEGTRALAEALAGRPVDALRLAVGARHASEASSMTVARTEIRTAEAIAHRELGDLAAALPVLEELAELRVQPAPHCRLLALLELARARLDSGDTRAAATAFDAATDVVENEMPGPGAMSWLARTGTLLALATGDVEGARGWSSQVHDSFWSAISAARVLLATGDARLAGEALESAEPRCLRHQVVADLLRFRVLEGAPEAEEHLLEAVRLAADHGLVQTVASEGRGVVEAVEKVAWRAPQAWLDRVRRASQPEHAHLGEQRVDLPIEALTERELAVLRMLPGRLTLREIADELFISINTLKFHLKVIYRKLGCSSRAEAAERARALAGLHRPGQPWSTRRR